MNEGWMKNDAGWMMSDEKWRIYAVEGFCWQTNRQTDIGECRVVFVTENGKKIWIFLPFFCIGLKVFCAEKNTKIDLTNLEK